MAVPEVQEAVAVRLPLRLAAAQMVLVVQEQVGKAIMAAHQSAQHLTPAVAAAVEQVVQVQIARTLRAAMVEQVHQTPQ